LQDLLQPQDLAQVSRRGVLGWLPASSARPRASAPDRAMQHPEHSSNVA
jgi:hypothetical protein